MTIRQDITNELNKTILKNIDKQTMINALRTIPTTRAEIIFNRESRNIIIQEPRGGVQVIIQSR